MKMYILVNCFLLCICIEFCYCSAGDSSPYYQKCLERSLILNCTDDGADFMYRKQDLILYYLKWSCEDECKYECMWKTVKAFNDRNWRTPQFYGKVSVINLLFRFTCVLFCRLRISTSRHSSMDC
ncbi:unnamed protein product [Acanthoscelides obtectus]|uniref:Post-GPI attachment to proteins factor 3 n=1 Tax=Acanthoscelides obtectus TaxID=200917 RepID=A0A9P0PR58_ACAOB|nr:unnamed protein product [Acanthoscelides obtectus]CAK1624361.1 Post-GPI attachment to proteins factor 3 [Acanthoscelides obtectus]